MIDLAAMYGNGYEIIGERRGERFTSEEFPSDTNERLGWEPRESLSEWIESVKECANVG